MRSLLYCMLNGKTLLARCSCRSGAIHHVTVSLSRGPRPNLIFCWSGQRGGKRAGQHIQLWATERENRSRLHRWISRKLCPCPVGARAHRHLAEDAHCLLKLRQKCGACLSNCPTPETGMVINNIHSSPHMTLHTIIHTYDTTIAQIVF